jgi:hypothetical protein
MTVTHNSSTAAPQSPTPAHARTCTLRLAERDGETRHGLETAKCHGFEKEKCHRAEQSKVPRV